MARTLSILAAALLTAVTPAVADTRVTVPGSAGGEYVMPVKTYKDMRFVNVIRQKMDFSCGSAALATLLTYSYDQPIDEYSVLYDMYERGDKDKIHKEGFSLLDMKAYLQRQGLKAEGFKAPLDKLAKVGIPAIVLLNRNGYMHFVVVKGVTADKVLVGDPAIGLVVHNRYEFEKMWNNIMFVVLSEKDVARRHFNSRALWAKRRQVFDSTMTAGGTDLSTFTGLNSSPNYY